LVEALARPRPLTNVSLLPSGRSLSVSRSMSLMFLSSVSQKRLRPTFSILSVELFAPCPPPPPPAAEPERICVATETVSVVSRAMFT
jgi:hypothetical protein